MAGSTVPLADQLVRAGGLVEVHRVLVGAAAVVGNRRRRAAAQIIQLDPERARGGARVTVRPGHDEVRMAEHVDVGLDDGADAGAAVAPRDGRAVAARYAAVVIVGEGGHLAGEEPGPRRRR